MKTANQGRDNNTSNYWSLQCRLFFSLKSWHRFSFTSFYYETTCFLKNFSKEWEMYMGENNGELCLVFFSFSLCCSNLCAPSLLSSQRSLLAPNWMSRGAQTPQSVSWVYIATTVLIYLRSCCQLQELQKWIQSAETDWLKNWRVNAEMFKFVSTVLEGC